ncbi:methyltransferase family protein [Pseudomonas sp. Marseille-Q8238]
MHALENRIPPPLVATFSGLLMGLIAVLTPGIDLPTSVRIGLSVALVALGLFFCLAGLVSFRRAKTTINPLRPARASALVSSGIYRISRNPMYVGFALFLLALAAGLASAWSLIGVVGFMLFIGRFQITPEERALNGLFGDEYSAYQRRVRRWI